MLKHNPPSRAVCAILACALLSGCTLVRKTSPDVKLKPASPEITQSQTENTPASADISEEPQTTAEPATTEVSDTSESASESSDTATTPPPSETTTEPLPQVITQGESQTGMTIETINGVTYVGGVLVANKTYALPESYYPGGLTDETYAAFAAMQSAAAAEGLSIYCKSGFRSYSDQRVIYWGYVDRDGQALADTYSARPGHSEHQSGMALDINSTSSDFAYTAEGIWLAEHCWDYGFIIRYPADKVDITGYMYEPWHVRYVGKDIAAELRDSGLCLEEYLGIDSHYRG